VIGPHYKYAKYVVRHKYYVFIYCMKLNVALWQALIHDWTKFLPVEWFPYVDFFYGRVLRPVGAGKNGYMHLPGEDADFDAAWNHHQKVNPHHWQYWVLIRDNDEPKLLPLRMPEKYVREMVADWCGAGRAQGHGDDIREWYAMNKDKMFLHDETRALVEALIGEVS
jgi:hypothetical protein